MGKVTSEGGKGEKAPEAAGPSAPPESAQGEKAAEWTVVARHKKAAAARSNGAAKQGTTKPAIAPSGGGSGGVPEKGTPSPEPPVRQGGKAARKTKHLTSEGQEHAATGDRTPASMVQRGTDSGKAGKKRNAEANLPTVARKCNRTGPASTIVGLVAGGVDEGAKKAPRKQKAPNPRLPSLAEAALGSTEDVEPMEEAPAEGQKGRKEPERAEGALRVDPLPATEKTSDAGPERTIEGPAAAGVAEGAQEGPSKEHLPRAPPSFSSDTGPETCVAEEGAAETAPEAGVGSADNAEPMQAAPVEGREGEEELLLPEYEPPRAPEASVGSADNAEPMQAAPAKRPEGGKEPPQKQEPPRAPEASVGSADNAEPMQVAPAGGSEGVEEHPKPEQELPQASLSCGDGGFVPHTAAEGDEETPPEAEAGSVEPALTLVSVARKGGEEPERAEGGALEVDPLPEVQRGQKTGPRPSIEGPVPVTEGAREEPLKQPPPRVSLSGGGGEGSGPRAAVGGGETSPEVVPVTDAEGGEGLERVYPLSLGEGGEGPERVDPLPSRAEDGPETVPRPSKEGPRAGTKPSGSAAYAERPSAPPKSRVQTVPARVPPPVSPAASPWGGAQGGPVKLKIRRNALTHQRECVVLYHREGGDGELREREEDTESTGSVGSERPQAKQDPRRPQAKQDPWRPQATAAAADPREATAAAADPREATAAAADPREATAATADPREVTAAAADPPEATAAAADPREVNSGGEPLTIEAAAGAPLLPRTLYPVWSKRQPQSMRSNSQPQAMRSGWQPQAMRSGWQPQAMRSGWQPQAMRSGWQPQAMRSN
ncbi:UNVERIFIED_CONTAM: hypothetical protein FKN15_052841 [Acipenser sinensis]